MRIVIAGCRGVPANYGGFETFADELSTRLVHRGHAVYVYCRTTSYGRGNWTSHHRGVKRQRVWAPRHKYFETVVSTALAVADATVRLNPDVIVVVNGINAWCSFFPRLRGIPVVLNVDGIERQRDKWNSLGKAAYRASERLSAFLPSALISDAEFIARYYRDSYGVESDVIRYGTGLVPRTPASELKHFGLAPGEYVLFVSRLEPENGAHDAIAAYASSEMHWPLVIVGDAPYATAYKKRLFESAEDIPGVIFLGGVYGEGYDALRGGAGIYVQATSVGGTHPALVEAMGAGNAIIARANVEHEEVLGDAALYFGSVEELSGQLKMLVGDDSRRTRLMVQARERARRHYAWDGVVSQYERLFARIASA